MMIQSSPSALIKPAGTASHDALAGQSGQPPKRKRWLVALIAAVCTVPVIASYLTYYVFKPAGGSANYGTLLEPQRPIPANLVVRTENGQLAPLQALTGKWLMLTVDASSCPESCVKKLYFMRQTRAAQGVEQERVTNIWLRTDDAPIAEVIARAYRDTRVLEVDPAALTSWLSTEEQTAITDHIYLIDPNGNLMMRFPKDANPTKIKKDLTKLLKWSGIG